jgi:hypothetical protein
VVAHAGTLAAPTASVEAALIHHLPPAKPNSNAAAWMPCWDTATRSVLVSSKRTHAATENAVLVATTEAVVSA